MKEKNVNFRNPIVCFLCFAATILTLPQVKAQDPVATGAAVVKGVYTAAKVTHDNWSTIKWTFGGMKHRWWACIYKDGFTTYNNFRSYRTSMDAYKYFVKGNGDCDAVYGNGGNRICYENPM